MVSFCSLLLFLLSLILIFSFQIVLNHGYDFDIFPLFSEYVCSLLTAVLIIESVVFGFSQGRDFNLPGTGAEKNCPVE